MANPQLSLHLIPFQNLERSRRPDKTNTCINNTDVTWNDLGDGDMHNYVYNELLSQTDLDQYLQVVRHLRSVYPVNTSTIFALHPTVDVITISHAFHYALFQPYEFAFSPSLDFITDCHALIKQLHANNIFHGNICPMLIGIFKGAPVIRPHPYMLLSRHVPKHQSLIPSPVQVIIDMLSSVLEKDAIEYAEFRNKFLKFWDYLLPAGLKLQIPQWAITAFASAAGCIDYVDHAINKYCIINQSKIDGKSYIQKTPAKAMGYLGDMDIFAFVISIFMMQRPVNSPPSKQTLQLLGKLLKGDEDPTFQQESVSSSAQSQDSVNTPTKDIVTDKKVTYKNQARVVRVDDKGEYIIFQKQKLYLPLPTTLTL